MVAAITVVGIDVSRVWLDGFCLAGLQRFRLANSPEGHEKLILMIRQMSAPIQVGFEATGGQEWLCGPRVSRRRSMQGSSRRPRSRPLRDHAGRGPRRIASMLSSLPASCCCGQRRDERCQVMTCVFSGS